MIDFRYHLVSLISVFLALAVGIVLGAGPLREPIGVSLQSQVDALRADRDNLRTELERSHLDTEQLSAYIDASAGELLSGALSDTSVVLVRAAGTHQDQADAVAGRIDDAGGSVAADIQLADTAFDAVDPDLLEELRDIDPELPDDDTEAVRTALAAALAGAQDPSGDRNGTASDSEVDEQTAQELFDVFADAGTISGDDRASADAVVVVAPAEESENDPDAGAADDAADAETGEPETEQPEDSGDAAAEPTEASIRLAAAFARTLSGLNDTVVAGSRASADHGLVAELRADSGDLTTVDSLDLAAGPVLVPLAVEATTGGAYGHYGMTESADSLLPEES